MHIRFVRLFAPFSLVAAFLLPGCRTTGFDTVSSGQSGDYPPPQIPPSLPSVPALPPPAARPVTGGVVRPGDTLELFVEEDDAFNGTYPVREQGDIIIRSVGRIQVAGLSVASAGSRVQTELEARHLKKATVMLDRVGRAPQEVADATAATLPPAVPQINVFLNGRVNQPGQHRIPLPGSGQLGVYEAVLISGGFANFADTARVHLLRKADDGTRKKIPVNLAGVEKGLAADPPIGDGDIVVVPEKIFGF